MRALFLVLALLLAVGMAEAAYIQGSIYNYNLDKITDVVVEIDTSPKQRIISKEGEYGFEVSSGRYKINVYSLRTNRSLGSDEVIITGDEGEFKLDLILAPEMNADEDSGFNPALLAGLFIVLLGIMIFSVSKRAFPIKEHEDEWEEEETELMNWESMTNYKKEIMAIMRENEGKISQKKLRKHFDLSEAKISLLVTELEKEGMIKKVRKGRQNLLVLKKKS